MMYYRTDQVNEFPPRGRSSTTQAAKGDGLVYQGSAYEGLTVDFLEFAFAAGGTVISEDGKKSTINSPENVKALQFMVDGIKNGAAPKAVTTMTRGAGPPRLGGRQGDVHAQLVVLLRALAEGAEGQGQVRRRAVPGVRGRRQGRRPRRPQHGHLGVLEEPGRSR